MLNTVGLTETGRTSTDTGHSFQDEKQSATGIAARYYMNNNFYIADPDAFMVAQHFITDQTWPQSKTPLTLDEAEVSISLAAIAGGMFELGDDLPTLGAEPDRLNLVRNPDLLDMVRLRSAAKPLDLMTYSADDEQPSLFLVHEDKRQSMLAVFNWTDAPRSHQFTFGELGLGEKGSLTATDVFHRDRPVTFREGVLRIENQPAHSVRLIKIVDSSIQSSNPSVKLQIPAQGALGVPIHFSATLEPGSSPVLGYTWNFGDGVSSRGASVDHTYTRNGIYNIALTIESLNGMSGNQNASITIQGTLRTTYDVEHTRRYQEH